MVTLDYQSQDLRRGVAHNYVPMRNLASCFIILQILLLLYQSASAIKLHGASTQALRHHLITFAPGAQTLLKADLLALIAGTSVLVLLSLTTIDLLLLTHTLRNRSATLIPWPDWYWRWRWALSAAYVFSLLGRYGTCSHVFQWYHVIDRTRAEYLFSRGLSELVVGVVVMAAIAFDGLRARRAVVRRMQDGWPRSESDRIAREAARSTVSTRRSARA